MKTSGWFNMRVINFEKTANCACHSRHFIDGSFPILRYSGLAIAIVWLRPEMPCIGNPPVSEIQGFVYFYYLSAIGVKASLSNIASSMSNSLFYNSRMIKSLAHLSL